jgi:hypothetical protein
MRRGAGHLQKDWEQCAYRPGGWGQDSAPILSSEGESASSFEREDGGEGGVRRGGLSERASGDKEHLLTCRLGHRPLCPLCYLAL